MTTHNSDSLGRNPESLPFARRDLLKGVTSLAVLTALAGCSPQKAPDRQEQQNDTLEINMLTMSPFESQQASAVAEQLGLHAGDYYQISATTASKISESGLFSTSESLAPIFFPAVMKHGDTIVKSCKEFGVPPNVFATLACIESAGNTQVRSGADAYGLVQVVPAYHYDKFAPYLPGNASLADYKLAKAGQPSNVALSEYTEVFTNVEYNTRAGAQYFKQCIEEAKKSYPKVPSLTQYAFAAAAYNGGIGRMRDGYWDMQAESQLYVSHASRILLDAEVALGLRARGLSDQEVLKAMQSRKMDAVAYAFGKMSRGKSSSTSAGNLSDYDRQYAEISKLASLSQASESFQQNVLAYYNKQTTQYTAPAAPGARIWLSSGGSGLFLQNPDNKAWKLN